MKLLIQIILVIILTWLAQLLGPWWVIFISSAIAGLAVSNKGFTSYLAGFLGVGILWFVQALFIDLANDSILSTRIAELFSLNSSILLVLVTAIIGGLCGGFGALTGKFSGDLFKREREKHSVYN